MKVIAGTNKRKKENDGDSDDKKTFTKETSEDTKKGKNTLKIPKSVTDKPDKYRYQRSVRPISNGHITSHSYTHPETGEYTQHEFFTEHDPFGHTEGIE